jgi:hypothetical protein
MHIKKQQSFPKTLVVDGKVACLFPGASDSDSKITARTSASCEYIAKFSEIAEKEKHRVRPISEALAWWYAPQCGQQSVA